MKKSSKLWGGRFEGETAKSVERFTSSIDIDSRLYKEDIEGSIAWANALKKAKVITNGEATRIINGLNGILKGIEKGAVKFKDELEDVHMNIESLLISRAGEAGKKLHTGRSRNDQVATDLRLYMKKEVGAMLLGISKLQKLLIKMSEDNIAVIMPGYTHSQQAQPVLLSHHLMAYFEMLMRDRERLEDAFKRIDVMPLGSGALAGTAYPIDREALAKELGFAKVSQNSMDAVSDRDFVAETLLCISLIMAHLSRFCAELISWSSSEFKFIEIGDAYTTGSSIMPQKKNPDVAELIRGKCGSVFGSLNAALTMIKGLPLTYNRDLQEDKSLIFPAIDTVKDSLSVFTEMLASVKFNAVSMKLRIDKSILATDIADHLVKKGVPFRSAHEIVGKLIIYSERAGKDIAKLSLSDMQKVSPDIEEDIYDALGLEKAVEARNVTGGTAKKQVAASIIRAKKRV